MIIGVLNLKGGVGKTTIAVNIAAVLAELGRRVLVVDADPQGSSLAWSAARQRDPLFPVISMPSTKLYRDLPGLAPDFGFVIIDGAAGNTELARSAMLASDVVLIPVQPSSYDIWGATRTVGLVSEAQQLRDNLKAAFVVNRKIVNSVLGRDVLRTLAHFELPILFAHLCQRVLYAESASRGLTVVEAGQRSEAACEVTALISSILKLVTEPSSSDKALVAA